MIFIIQSFPNKNIIPAVFEFSDDDFSRCLDGYHYKIIEDGTQGMFQEIFLNSDKSTILLLPPVIV